MELWDELLKKDKTTYKLWAFHSREELAASSIHRLEGLTAEDEAFLRRYYTQFIMETGKQLKTYGQPLHRMCDRCC